MLPSPEKSGTSVIGIEHEIAVVDKMQLRYINDATV